MIRGMKKTLRILRRIFVVLLALAVLLLILCLDGVDTRPYLREPYRAETTLRLRTSAETNTVSRGVLSAGFGRDFGASKMAM